MYVSKYISQISLILLVPDDKKWRVPLLLELLYYEKLNHRTVDEPFYGRRSFSSGQQFLSYSIAVLKQTQGLRFLTHTWQSSGEKLSRNSKHPVQM